MINEQYALKKKAIGLRIATERKKLKTSSGKCFSQEDLAESMNNLYNCDTVSQSTISQWEQGNTLPPMDRLIALSTIFSCDCAYLLCDYDDRSMSISQISEYTGLSEEAVSRLSQINAENRHLWWSDILSAAIETEDFLSLLSAISDFATTPNETLTMLYPRIIQTHDIDRIKAQNALQAIMTHLKKSYKGREDNRQAYQFIWNCYQNGDLSVDEYLKYRTDFDNGDFSAVRGEKQDG